jgi:hypothetical protein
VEWLWWFALVVTPLLTLLLFLAMGVIIVQAKRRQRHEADG